MTNPLTKRAGRAISAVTATLAVAGIITATMTHQQDPQPSQAHSVTVTEAALEPTKPVDTKPVDPETVEAPVAAEPVQTVTNPSPAPEAATAPVEQPRTYKYAADMAAAGIAESDYGYVTDMLLEEEAASDHGWRVVPQGGRAVWYRAMRAPEGTLSNKLDWANRYVFATYGTWEVAHRQYVRAGNF